MQLIGNFPILIIATEPLFPYFMVTLHALERL